MTSSNKRSDLSFGNIGALSISANVLSRSCFVNGFVKFLLHRQQAC
jgi:hypothetical protein